MIVSTVEHADGCRTQFAQWDEESGETKCPECGATLEDHEVDIEMNMTITPDPEPIVELEEITIEEPDGHAP